MKRGSRAVCVALACASAIGCASVPSSVKGLVDVQAKAGARAKAASEKWTKKSADQAQAFDLAVQELDAAMRGVQAEEAKYALVFSSNQNLDTKSKLDAAAAAYLIGEIYLADQDGLSSAVQQQFTDSEAALVKLSTDIDASWAKIAKLQKQIQDFSEKSAIAAVDADFVATLSGKISGSDGQVSELLANAKKLKQALDQSAKLKVDPAGSVSGTRTATGDLIELLDKLDSAKRAGH